MPSHCGSQCGYSSTVYRSDPKDQEEIKRLKGRIDILEKELGTTGHDLIKKRIAEIDAKRITLPHGKERAALYEEREALRESIQ